MNADERIRHGLVLIHNAIMIAGNGENRRVVIAIRIVKLLRIIFLLPEVVDNVAKMKEEGRQSSRISLAVQVGSHRVGHGKLRLGFHHAASVSHGMKDKLPSLLNRGDRTRRQHRTQIHHRRLDAGCRDRLRDLLRFQSCICFDFARAVGEEVICGDRWIGKAISIRRQGEVLAGVEIRKVNRSTQRATVRAGRRSGIIERPL